MEQSKASHPMEIPQGDPLSPLALNAIMWASYSLVETHAAAADGQRLQLIYMDDRSFTAHTPHTLINTLDQWHHFSIQIGIQQNRSKTKLTTASTPQRRQLQAFLIDRPELQQCITQSACILGTYTTTNTVHGLQPKERERLATAKAVLKRIQYFPVDGELYLKYLQAVYIPSYSNNLLVIPVLFPVLLYVIYYVIMGVYIYICNIPYTVYSISFCLS